MVQHLQFRAASFMGWPGSLHKNIWTSYQFLITSCCGTTVPPLLACFNQSGRVPATREPYLFKPDSSPLELSISSPDIHGLSRPVGSLMPTYWQGAVVASAATSSVCGTAKPRSRLKQLWWQPESRFRNLRRCLQRSSRPRRADVLVEVLGTVNLKRRLAIGFG